LIVDCPPLPEPVYVDREMWEKVVLNLLSNALKFTFEGEVAVSLRPVGGAAELRVRDTGTGIPAEEVPRLFERFHRVEGARARTHEGTGIGLALVRELVKQHGGGVDVESVMGEGTTFTVCVPLGSSHLPPARVGATASLASTATGSEPYVEEALRWLPDTQPDVASRRGDRPRVLIADDNADMRQYIARLLSAHYEVDTVPDGERALAAIRAEPPDLLLADIMMPRLTGLELVSALRADPATRTLPVILLSALAGEDARLDGLAAGADDYLVKPFSARELQVRVGSSLALARARRDAEASEARYRAIVEGQAEMVCRFRPDGTILFANGAYARAVGTTPDALTGVDFWDFIVKDDQASVRRMLDELSAEAPEVRIENRIDTTGGPRWTLWTNRALAFDEDGRATEVQSSGIDITDRRRAEDALRDAARRKDEFLAMLAHELRNPLAPLRTGLEVMKQPGAGDETVGRVRTVMERQLTNLVRLVDDLLDVSRISRGHIELRLADVELAGVIQHAIETVRPLVDDAGHDLSVSLPGEPLYVHADPTRLGQVFANLLHNAVKFTEPGGHIRLTAEREGENAVVRVTDDGVGIPAAALPAIFDLFTQVGGASGTRTGLGIGLTLVRQLIERHGGRVDAYSDGPGAGSTFVVRLPLAAPDVAGLPAAVAETPAAAARRILVVDDNEDAATSLAMLLGIMGHDARTTFDGESALEEAARFRPHVVLLDLGMPALDGYDVARRLRAEPWGRGVMLVALTGWGQEEHKRRSEQAGFDRHLVKPVDRGALESLLAP
jgi:PAS domain S-box-containing protein